MYVYTEKENSGKTIAEIRIPIIARPRPSGLYTPEQIDNYSAILADLTEVLDKAEDITERAEEAVPLAESWANATATAVKLDPDQEPTVVSSFDEDGNRVLEFGIPVGGGGGTGDGTVISINGVEPDDDGEVALHLDNIRPQNGEEETADGYIIMPIKAEDSDKLGGLPASDYATWKDLPSSGGGSLPSGGTLGQVIMKTEDSAGWADQVMSNIMPSTTDDDTIEELVLMHIKADSADNAANSDKLGNQPPSYYAKANDLQAVYAKVEALESGVEIVPTVSGSVIAVNDASDLQLRGLKLYGKTTQNGTPSPDAPVELVTAGADGEIKSYIARKNTFPFDPDKAALTTSGITFTPLGDGRYHVTGTATASAQFHVNGSWKGKTGFTIFPGALKGPSVGEGKVVAFWYGFREDGTYSSLDDNSLMYKDVYCYLQVDSGKTVDEIVCPYVSYIERSYEPYSAHTIVLATPDGLPGIPVSSGGNYTDASGQQWICDEIDLERGVKIHRVKEHLYNGSENWDVQEVGSSKVFSIQSMENTIIRQGISNYGYVSYETLDSGGYGCTIAYTVRVRSQEWNPDKHSPAEFKSYLASNNLRIIVPLSDPTEIALTADELAAYRALVTNKPNTTIYNDAGCDQTVRYVADTQTYINNRIQAQTASLAEELEATKILLGVE